MQRFLTAQDKALLASYKFKTDEVKDFTKACLKGTHTGLLLFGSGGNGKSYSIRETFAEQKMIEIEPEETQQHEDDDDEDDDVFPHEHKEFGYDTFVSHLGRVTPKGLVKEKAKFPQSAHLVEDAETMFDDKNCWGVLRMALHSQDHSLHSRRRITWKISTKDSYDFWFQGSLMIVGNRLLDDSMEEVNAVKTRCPCLNFNVENAELIAKMKELCERGYTEIAGTPLTKDDCYSVLEFILDAIEDDPELKRDGRGKEKKLNLRILISGFRFLALSRIEKSINWRNMLVSQLKQQVGASKRTRKERIYDETQIAKEVVASKYANQHEKLVEWCKRTGRDLAWAGADRNSDIYIKGFRAAKTDLARKNK